MRSSKPVWERVLAKVVDDAETSCWIFTGGVNSAGYGQISTSANSMATAHRIVFEHFIGPIPDGMDLDHLCRVRRCVNPTHLEPVTRGENLGRGNHPNMVTRRTGICQRGHDLSVVGVNIRVRASGTTKRSCAACARLHEVARNARRKARRHALAATREEALAGHEAMVWRVDQELARMVAA